ncbi:terpene synthase family protein [Streptomyces spectabilis]
MRLVTNDESAAILGSFKWGWLTAAMYPTMPVADLCLLTQWHCAMALPNDLADCPGALDDRDAIARMSRAMLDSLAPGRPQSPIPAARAFGDLWHRTAPGRPIGWQERATLGIALWVNQFAPQAEARPIRRAFTLDDYLDMRRSSVGLDMNADILEGVLRLDIPEAVFSTDVVRKLKSAWIDVNAWAKDLYSYPREQTYQQNPHNLVAVLASHSLTETAAITKTLSMLLQRAEEFLRLERLLPELVRSADQPGQVLEALNTYASALKSYTYGHFMWVSQTSRYTGGHLHTEAEFTSIMPSTTP